jgi:dynamin 1-like protein
MMPPKKNKDPFELLEHPGSSLVNNHIDSTQSPLPNIFLSTMPIRMRAEEEGNSRMKIEVNIIKNLIQSYFDVVRKNMSDMVPKTIMAFLVAKSRQIAQGELVEEIYSKENINDLMIEDPMIAKNRETVLNGIKALRQAQNILNEATQFKYQS